MAAVILLVLGKRFIFNDKSAATKVPAKKNQAPVGAEILVVNTQDYEEKIKVTGSIQPEEWVDLQPETSGKVMRIGFIEGSSVSQGQLLVKINDAELQAQKNKVLAQLANARLEQDRLKNLWDARAVSKDQYDKAVLLTQTLDADLQFISAQIAKTEIRAPFSGTIGARNISAGAIISASTVIARLYQNRSLKVRFEVPVRYKAKIKPGRIVQLTGENNVTATASIFSIEPGADPDVRSIVVLARLINNQSQLSSGEFVNVNLTLDKVKNVVLLPTEAVVPVLKGQRVFVMDNGKAAYRDIEILSRNDSSVVVKTGLLQGDTVVTRGIMFLKPGSVVKPVKVRN